MCLQYIAVDRGHTHSDGTTEISIWIRLKGDTNHSGAETASAEVYMNANAKVLILDCATSDDDAMLAMVDESLSSGRSQERLASDAEHVAVFCGKNP